MFRTVVRAIAVEKAGVLGSLSERRPQFERSKTCELDVRHGRGIIKSWKDVIDCLRVSRCISL